MVIDYDVKRSELANHHGDKEIVSTIEEISDALPSVIVNDNKFIEGKDGWVYLGNDTNDILGQLTGRVQLTPFQIDAWCNLLESRRKKFNSLGIRYLHTIAPNKECIYAEYLPEGIELSEDRPVRQLLAGLKERHLLDTLCYPYDVIQSGKNLRPTHPCGDSHWNWYGSFLAYQEMMQRIGILPVSSDDVIFTNEEKMSDLAAKLGRADIVTIAKIKNNKTKCTYRNGVKAVGNLLVYENEDKSLPVAVVFRDSFTAQLADYLGQHFSKMVLVWQQNMDWSIIERENPAYVLSIQAERFIIRVPDDIRGRTNAQNVERKLGKRA